MDSSFDMTVVALGFFGAIAMLFAGVIVAYRAGRRAGDSQRTANGAGNSSPSSAASPVVASDAEHHTDERDVHDEEDDIVLPERAADAPISLTDAPELVEVPTLITAAVHEISAELDERANVVQSFGETPSILVAPGAMRRALVALLRNAAQAMPEGRRGQIEVRCRSTRRGRVSIEILDDGTGLSPDTQRRAFDPGFSTRGREGRGLGFANQAVAEAGGRLELHRRSEGGARVRIVLPMADAAPAEPSLEPTQTRSGQVERVRVLVIDDEPLVARAIQRVLGSHRTEIAQSAAAGRAKLLADDYDVVFCDLRMPGTSGAALYGELEAMAHPSVSRFVFMTGAAVDEDTETFLERPGRVWIAKPFQGEDLRNAIAAIIRANTVNTVTAVSADTGDQGPA